MDFVLLHFERARVDSSEKMFKKVYLGRVESRKIDPRRTRLWSFEMTANVDVDFL